MLCGVQCDVNCCSVLCGVQCDVKTVAVCVVQLMCLLNAWSGPLAHATIRLMSDTHTVITQPTSPIHIYTTYVYTTYKSYIRTTVKALKCMLQLPTYVAHTRGGLQGNTYVHTACSCAVQRVCVGEGITSE